MRASKLALCTALAALSLGCAQTIVRSGLPPASSAPMHHERWHATFLFGAIEARTPYALTRLCPDGWAEVSVGPDPFTVIAGALTLFIYAPTRVTVICAAKSAAEPPSAGGSAAPASAESQRSSVPAPPPPESF